MYIYTCCSPFKNEKFGIYITTKSFMTCATDNSFLFHNGGLGHADCGSRRQGDNQHGGRVHCLGIPFAVANSLRGPHSSKVLPCPAFAWEPQIARLRHLGKNGTCPQSMKERFQMATTTWWSSKPHLWTHCWS